MTEQREVYPRCCFNNHGRGRRHIVWVLISVVPLLLLYFTFYKYHVGVLKSDFLIQLKVNKNLANQSVRSEQIVRNKGVSSKSIKGSKGNGQDSEIHYETSTKNLIPLNKLLADKIDHKTDKWQKVSLNSSVKGIPNEYNKAFNVTLNENRNITNKNGSKYPESSGNNRKQPAPIKLVARKFPRNFEHVDLMKMEPFTFLEEYRNPCYAVEQTEDRKLPLQCIPYFYLIGAPKSGTTDLFRRITKHREISENVVKEPHWLTRKRFSSNPYWASYEEYFRAATRQINAKKDPDGFHPVIVGDCSASTLWDNDYWTFLPEYKNLTEPLYTNADYIHHFNPDAKIIAILRNPIDRLYSDYLYFTAGKDKGPERFHERVKKTGDDYSPHLRLKVCQKTSMVFTLFEENHLSSNNSDGSLTLMVNSIPMDVS
ncbi:carbohydrate sulfotransferase 15-like [Mya arenaria]|uniref:carbohydrate sulfotransferase 15-like n=1 Tax=Mya arenaria TaxID=6604 RepID=UPI0022E210B6|nr:carbohydrate sulfotransferase 15-like [Mya arenaria]